MSVGDKFSLASRQVDTSYVLALNQLPVPTEGDVENLNATRVVINTIRSKKSLKDLTIILENLCRGILSPDGREATVANDVHGYLLRFLVPSAGLEPEAQVAEVGAYLLSEPVKDTTRTGHPIVATDPGNQETCARHAAAVSKLLTSFFELTQRTRQQTAAPSAPSGTVSVAASNTTFRTNAEAAEASVVTDVIACVYLYAGTPDRRGGAHAVLTEYMNNRARYVAANVTWFNREFMQGYPTMLAMWDATESPETPEMPRDVMTWAPLAEMCREFRTGPLLLFLLLVVYPNTTTMRGVPPADFFKYAYFFLDKTHEAAERVVHETVNSKSIPNPIMVESSLNPWFHAAVEHVRGLTAKRKATEQQDRPPAPPRPTEKGDVANKKHNQNQSQQIKQLQNKIRNQSQQLARQRQPPASPVPSAGTVQEYSQSPVPSAPLIATPTVGGRAVGMAGSAPPFGQKSTKRRCYKCNQEGHMARECPNK